MEKTSVGFVLRRTWPKALVSITQSLQRHWFPLCRASKGNATVLDVIQNLKADSKDIYGEMTAF